MNASVVAVRFLLFFSVLPVGLLAAPPSGSSAPSLENAWDIGVIDRGTGHGKTGPEDGPIRRCRDKT